MQAVLALAALAAPLVHALPSTYQNLTNFYLVTSSSRDYAANSSSLPAVSAISLFDADRFGDDLYQLRLIEPGYNSLPRFNLTGNTLHTIAYGPVGNGEYDYESTEVEIGEELEFDPTPEGETGHLELKGGYLLAVDGDCSGWTVCEGESGQDEIFWKGEDSTCQQRYIHAVKTAPY